VVATNRVHVDGRSWLTLAVLPEDTDA
jgi:hypothetical protein